MNVKNYDLLKRLLKNPDEYKFLEEWKEETLYLQKLYAKVKPDIV